MWRKKRAVSPVVATIILLAVVITTSVAVAYWMGGISTQHTLFEKIEVGNAVASITNTGSVTTWTVSIALKNTGTSTARITDIYLNDRYLTNSGGVNPPEPEIGNGGWYTASPTITSGSSTSFIIVVRNGGEGQPFTNFSSGTAMSFRLHSAAGMDYYKLLEPS